MIEWTERGWYCPGGGFYIDPSAAVSQALITHAHSDHARPGSTEYLCAANGMGILRKRLGSSCRIHPVQWGEVLDFKGYKVSFHPAGHVLGSAQIRVEHRGEIWVVSGDYKNGSDPTCEPLEPVRCHTFITESTFGLPLYRWPDSAEVFHEIHDWWRYGQALGRTCFLHAYSLGKAQRLLAGLDPALGPILVHASVMEFVPDYEAFGVSFPKFQKATPDLLLATRGRAMVILPKGTALGEVQGLEVSTAAASGWMQGKRMRSQRGEDRGFVLSDHADWDGLNSVICATGAEHVLVTHGHTESFARWLNHLGIDARAVPEIPPRGRTNVVEPPGHD